MESIYLEAYDEGNGSYRLSLESFIIINICKLGTNPSITVHVKIVDKFENDWVIIDLSFIKFEIIKFDPPEITSFCVWPALVVNDNYVIAGLCSISRRIIKNSSEENVRKLLGFKNACLVACNETSIWTRFCEVDMVQTTKLIQKMSLESSMVTSFILPVDLMRFDHHLSEPIKIHNVYKIAREMNNDKSIKSTVPVTELNLHHKFSEGPFVALSDVILFYCYQVIFGVLGQNILQDHLKLTIDWFNNVRNTLPVSNYIVLSNVIDVEHIRLPTIIAHSLYDTDTKRYSPKKRPFTKQKDIDNSLDLIGDTLKISNKIIPYGNDIAFDWYSLPSEINPLNGAIPAKRAQRKSEQLETLARAVKKLVGTKSLRIVDFCSGSGHLGLLLACLLPQTDVILVENKERSLIGALERIQSLKLKNIRIVQTNLDYFVGRFDVGTALHACGVATDLVIECCIEKGADFVCCPCCYGGIRDCHHMKYPRSGLLAEKLSVGEFMVLAHAADQTHGSENGKTGQGFRCMDVIDTDRKLYAEKRGYTVCLGKLQPITCTNKNNLLVGVKLG